MVLFKACSLVLKAKMLVLVGLDALQSKSLALRVVLSLGLECLV